MIIEVIDREGLSYAGELRPLSIWIETDDLKVQGSACHTKVQMLGIPPDFRVLLKPGSVRNGRISWG